MSLLSTSMGRRDMANKFRSCGFPASAHGAQVAIRDSASVIRLKALLYKMFHVAVLDVPPPAEEMIGRAAAPKVVSIFDLNSYATIITHDSPAPSHMIGMPWCVPPVRHVLHFSWLRAVFEKAMVWAEGKFQSDRIDIGIPINDNQRAKIAELKFFFHGCLEDNYRQALMGLEWALNHPIWSMVIHHRLTADIGMTWVTCPPHTFLGARYWSAWIPEEAAFPILLFSDFSDDGDDDMDDSEEDAAGLVDVDDFVEAGADLHAVVRSSPPLLGEVAVGPVSSVAASSQATRQPQPLPPSGTFSSDSRAADNE